LLSAILFGKYSSQYKGHKKLDSDISEQINLMLSNDELPARLSHLYKLVSIKIRQEIDFYKFVAFMLILMFFIFPRPIISGENKYSNKLIISLWERIQELENEVRELKAGTQVDG
jgi:hypothetical protein